GRAQVEGQRERRRRQLLDGDQRTARGRVVRDAARDQEQRPALGLLLRERGRELDLPGDRSTAATATGGRGGRCALGRGWRGRRRRGWRYGRRGRRRRRGRWQALREGGNSRRRSGVVLLRTRDERRQRRSGDYDSRLAPKARHGGTLPDIEA